MKNEVTWLDDALAVKDLELSMTHFYVSNNQIQATDGRLLAGHPCQVDGEFLVPGEDLQRILDRLPTEPKITLVDDTVQLRSGRFHGSIQTLDLSELWRFPEAGTIDWKQFPSELLPILRDLRPFVSENAVHRWATGICLQDGWALASNNVVLVGAKCPNLHHIIALLPSQVVDFILKRTAGLTEWAITDYYLAFRWSHGAWMRSTLIDDKFPERAAAMIKQKVKPTQTISKDYREAVARIASLTDGPVSIYADRVTGRTDFAEISETLVSEIPKDTECSRWGSSFVGSVIAVATAWSPSLWPNPVPFVGERVVGYIAGLR